jgi:hypothetical protein
MESWSTPFEFVANAMWHGVAIQGAIWFVITAINLRVWEIWTGDDR